MKFSNQLYFFIVGSSLLLSACGGGSGGGGDGYSTPTSSSSQSTLSSVSSSSSVMSSSSSSSTSSSSQNNGVTLAQLQQNIFGAVCTNCHVGASAPRGLRLDSEDNSYAFLVNQASGEKPDLMRVNPGNPGQSYLIQKLEGASGIVGGRMPLGGPYLTDAQINLVRTWITNGAPRTGTGLNNN
jgi:hypothetical protein